MRQNNNIGRYISANFKKVLLVSSILLLSLVIIQSVFAETHPYISLGLTNIKSNETVLENPTISPHGSISGEEAINSTIIFLMLYQRYISKQLGDKCNFEPSCSQYSKAAVKKYGLLRGTIMTTDRLMRCHYCAGLYYEHKKGKLFDPIEDNVF